MHAIPLASRSHRPLMPAKNARRSAHLAPPTPFRVIDVRQANRILRSFTPSTRTGQLLDVVKHVTRDQLRNSIIIALASYYEWEPRITPEPHRKGYWQNGSALLGYWEPPDLHAEKQYWNITPALLRELLASEHHDGIHFDHDHHGLLRDGGELILGSERLDLATHSVHKAVQSGIVSKGIGTEISALTAAYLECPVIHMGQDTKHFKLIVPYDANGKSGAYLYLVKTEDEHPFEGNEELLLGH